jgi:hypothetical protein
VEKKELQEKCEKLQKELKTLERIYLPEVIRLNQELYKAKMEIKTLKGQNKIDLEKLNEANNELFELRKKVGE